MNYFIGIDPGLSGAIAIIKGNNANNIKIIDMPITKTIKKGKNKKNFNIDEISKIFRSYQGKNVYVALESVHAMPHQGVSSTFLFGRGFGILEGILSAFTFDYELVTPMTWKKMYKKRLILSSNMLLKIKDFQKNKSKKLNEKQQQEYDKLVCDYDIYKSQYKKNSKREARFLASELFPSIKDHLLREKDDGRAEALLMAEYKRRIIKSYV